MEPINSPISSVNKKLLCREKDRIRDLPEPVLHHILSFLDLKETVRTSVLSTRWRYLWASLPFLNFDCNLFESHKAGKAKAFRDFVDQVLFLRHDYCNIQSFRLNCYGLDDYDDLKSIRLNAWIRTALKRNLQELYLNIHVVEKEFRLHNSIFTCDSLTKLELYFTSDGTLTLKLNLPDSMSLPLLETLLLRFVTIEGENIPNKIFSKCPALESLTIIDCDFPHQSLVFTTPKLKHLAIERLYYCGLDRKGYIITLYAPNLISFRCKDYMSNQYWIENLSAVVQADIDIQGGQYDEGVPPNDTELNFFCLWMVNILRALPSVEALTLPEWFLDTVSHAVFARTAGILFSNLRRLKLVALLSEKSYVSITSLLMISPNIESLLLQIKEGTQKTSPWFQNWDEVPFIHRAKVETLLNGEAELQDMMYHLKFVEIRGVQGRINELLFLGFLLKHATVLVKLTVFTSKEHSPHRERRLAKFTEKLSALPRASSSIAIFFF